MGFFSAGRDQGSTFYFELPLYTAAFVGLSPEQAAGAMQLSQSRATITPPMEVREITDPTRRGLGTPDCCHNHEVDGKENDEENVRHAAGNIFHVADMSQESERIIGIAASSARRKSPRQSLSTELGALFIGTRTFTFLFSHDCFSFPQLLSKHLAAIKFIHSTWSTRSIQLMTASPSLCGSCSW